MSDPMAEYKAANPCSFPLEINGSITWGYGPNMQVAEIDAHKKYNRSLEEKKQTFNTEINKRTEPLNETPMPSHWKD